MSDIILGDCLEKMKDIPDNSIDMILTDLPYGVTARNKWDVIIPFDKLWEQWNRIKKETTPIVLTSMQPFSSLLVNSNLKDFKYEIIWNKKLVTGHLNAKKQVLRQHEQIVIFYSKQCTYNPQRVKGNPTHSRGIPKEKDSLNYGKEVHTNNINDLKYPTSILEIQKVQSGKCVHPTEKPVELFEYLIKTYSNEGDMVLDCCAGSGTAGVACKNLNRNYILIEKEPKYYDLMKDRIESQTTLDTITEIPKYSLGK